MSSERESTVALFARMARNEPGAQDELVLRVYPELHKLAAQCLGPARGRTSLEPSVLVNEAWMKMSGREGLEFEHRGAFLSFASKVMRSVLVDHARAAAALRRGGAHQRVSQILELVPDQAQEVDLLALEEALHGLEEIDPECVRLVELRFFGGLAHPEIATVLGTSLRHVERRWKFTRAWLHSALAP